MRIKATAALSLLSVAAAITTGVATAGSSASQQRIAITSPSGNSGAFVLVPLTSGAIVRDSGTASACCWSRRFIKRDGQDIEIDNPLRTFEGKRGTFAWRARIEWVDTGNGYSVGTGTWRIVRGTGAYLHLQGHGRLAVLTGAADQNLTTRAEGLLELRG